MSEAKFTKGPWLTRQGLDEDEIEVYPAAKAPHGLQKAEIATVKDYHDDYEANAHLIAAAPELYELLDRVRDFARELGDEGLYEDADAALAKARGEIE